VNAIKVVAHASGRSAYRVVPDPDDPIILQLDGKLTRVLDISATGFSAPVNVVKAGRRYPFSIDLPTTAAPLNGYVDALPNTEDGDLHCQFVDLSADAVDLLHHYVLVRQKDVLRAMHAGKSSRSG
jgi:hypothetical protein